MVADLHNRAKSVVDEEVGGRMQEISKASENGRCLNMVAADY